MLVNHIPAVDGDLVFTGKTAHGDGNLFFHLTLKKIIEPAHYYMFSKKRAGKQHLLFDFR